jgi:hypothetical protein
MESDMIVILGLALMFFGGIGYIVWKERNGQKSQAAELHALAQTNGQPIEKSIKRKP